MWESMCNVEFFLCHAGLRVMQKNGVVCLTTVLDTQPAFLTFDDGRSAGCINEAISPRFQAKH